MQDSNLPKITNPKNFQLSAKSQSCAVFPNQLTSLEYRELNQESGIHPDLIKLNFFHLDEHNALDRLFISEKLKRTNTGTVSYGILKKYRHIEIGGWWVSGVDVTNHYSDDLYGQFKPLKPRLSADKGKVIKYEGPPKYPTGAIALKVSSPLWRAIAIKHDIRLNDRHLEGSFWEWVVNNPKIPLVITEGAKKAACLLSAGYAAIALPGVFNGYRQPKDEQGRKIGLPKLIPQLKAFAQEGRPVYFAFDKDNKASTIATVNMAIAKTGNLFAKTKVDVKVINWQELAKGVDDLIIKKGVEAFDAAYGEALSLGTWLVRSSIKLSYEPNIQVNRRYLGSLANKKNQDSQNQKENQKLIDIPDNAKLVCLKSPKGSGKTHLLEQIVDNAINEGKWVLLLTHRIQLGEALCQRLGLPYLTEIRTVEYGTVLGYGLCVDSLHPNSGARFNADNWQDGVVIIDEAEQVIWHLLNSTTCASERVEILAQFKNLIQNNLSDEGKVYLADADLSDISINYIRGLAGFHVDPFVIVNNWKPPKTEQWKIHNYEDKSPALLVRDLVYRIKAGDRPFISCSAQKIKSKWGTQNLESYLQQQFPNKKIIRIDSESVADPTHPAYGCIAHLNEILPQYDIAIASPSIETGVSIECQKIDKSYSKIPLAFQLLAKGINPNLAKLNRIPHFDSVWAIAQGVQSTDSIRQALARVRANVPRYLWAAKRGFYKCMVGNGATSKKALISAVKNRASKNIQFLTAADASLNSLNLDTNFQPESLNTWAKRGCYINLTMKNYRGSILDGLIAEGHFVTLPHQFSENNNSSTEIESELKQVVKIKYQEDCNYVVTAPNPTDKEYQILKEKRAKTKSERWIERKGSLIRRYGENVPFTPDLVAKDDDGWYRKLLYHYYLTIGRPYLIIRDSQQVRAIAKKNKENLWMPDFNRNLLSTQLRLLETLIIGLLKPNIEHRGSDSNIQFMAELAFANRREIKTFLGLTIVESDSPIQIAQKLLSLLGLKLTCIGRFGSRSQRERVYVFHCPKDDRDLIFHSWQERDELNLQVFSPSGLEIADLTSVSTIGKRNTLFPIVDQKKKEDDLSQGKIVQWLKAQGEWILEATTGMIAKIKDSSGEEKIVSCQELRNLECSILEEGVG